MATLSKVQEFYIGEEKIVLSITCKDGYYESNIIKGDTGTGWSGGGKFSSIEEYAAYRESQHRYSAAFFGGKNKLKAV